MKENLNAEQITAMVKRLYLAAGGDSYYDEPLVSFASADDEWYRKYKTLIGPFHWTPLEALHFDNPEATAKSVIVWILPVKESIRKANRAENWIPAVSWAAMRSFGELVNENMRKQLCLLLKKSGYSAIAPHLEQVRQGYDIVKMNFSSHWSERHTAFVAGLGTFGLSAGLITEKGVAMRVGSVVTDLELPPAKRPYGDDPFAWCTKCGACARRCPGHAIGKTIEERDKPKCGAYVVANVNPEREKRYGWLDLNLGCGLCQTGVPCEFKRP